MNHLLMRSFTLYFPLLIFISCQSSSNKTKPQEPTASNVPETTTYRGNISSAQYDSIVNQLTLYNNETFVLHQVDRIAEHHLNDREHPGIYAYLADSTQLALYSEDGMMMLRFKLSDNDLIPIALDDGRILDSSNIWKRQKSGHH